MSAMTDMAAETRLTGGGLASLPRVNLLPPEIAEQAQFRKVQVGLGGALVAVVVATGLLYMGASSSVSDAQTSLDSVTAETTQLQRQASELSSVTQVYNQATQAQAMLTQAMGDEVRYSRFLNDLSLSVPDNVWITSATFAQSATQSAATTTGSTAALPTGATLGTVTFSGMAFDHNDVAQWLDSLSRQKGFSDPTLQNSTKSLLGSRTVVNWSSTVNLTPAALSGRYVTSDGS